MKQLKFIRGENKEIFLALSIILGFMFIVSFVMLYVSDAIKNSNACGCKVPIPYMIFLLSSLGLFIGCLVFYILVSRFIREKKKIGSDIESTLNFLESDERKVFRSLIDGDKIQSDIERDTGLHRVKIHRLVTKLQNKDIINKDTDGKVTKISLKQNFKDLFI